MNNLILESTKHTPAINFLTDGRMFIKGRSIPEDINDFYAPLIEWAGSVTAPRIILDIKLEYFNSSSAKKMLELLKALDKNSDIRELTVNWFFEQDDDDALECGQIFEESLRKANFRYYESFEAA